VVSVFPSNIKINLVYLYIGTPLYCNYIVRKEFKTIYYFENSNSNLYFLWNSQIAVVALFSTKKIEKKFKLSMYFLEFDQSKHCTR
jgi:hypothetical protein